jgi:hypothetical protein
MAPRDPVAASTPSTATMAEALTALLDLESSILERGLDLRWLPRLQPLAHLMGARGWKVSARDVRRFGAHVAELAIALQGTARVRRGAHPDEFELFAAKCVWRFRLTALGRDRRLARRLLLCAGLWKTGKLRGVVGHEAPRWDGLWSLPLAQLEMLYAQAMRVVPNLEATLRPTDAADESTARRKHYAKCMPMAAEAIAEALLKSQACG